MYKAIHSITGEEIIILSPLWIKRLGQLRDLDQNDLLVCQGCRQPLRVKAGELKRPHFAHKHLQACSFGTESPEILQARAVLYHWLEKQFGGVVTLEKVFQGSQLPRAVDCWVEMLGGPFAYWIIEAGIKAEPRHAIKLAVEQNNFRVHWVFLSKMLIEEKKEFQSVLLTPTERAFLQTTPFDEMEAGAGEPGATLHYLDLENEILTTYRALTLFHRPNWYKGIRKITKLDAVVASRLDGGIIHPGEMTRLRTIRAKKKRLENKRQKFQERETALEDRLSAPPAYSRRPPNISSEQSGQEIPDFEASLPCATCGQVTTDYWSVFYDHSGRKLCRCRECLNRPA
ncbi:MAG: hypothetical protein IH585_05330 [Anaerolineaceae bacterium]|nr:hypothetical protein [Anaerolineaceae bacterium]